MTAPRRRHTLRLAQAAVALGLAGLALAAFDLATRWMTAVATLECWTF